ncbi:shikimate dehydrogenase family protein [Oceaniglobus indicus]|uniref:shikimate dehydrogenase family protein n=1 Tax=Oceaniglobus indicus TaxID=2047749 RepID=UPI001F4E6FD9|nr:shikimate dehydrogenase [Oceaniglobus indicus]
MTLRLGLIGGNIGASQAPRLHRLAGQQSGIDVRYDLLTPGATGVDFTRIFAGCVRGGYRGVNITYPYKERVMGLLHTDAATLRTMGAVNTVVFGADRPRGFNTDHSGFIATYRGARGDLAPGPVLLIGAGGVGRAVAFGLLSLGVSDLRLVDRDPVKAAALARDLRSLAPDLRTTVSQDGTDAAVGARGLINCTPLGMTGIGGTPLSRAAMTGAEWAFDAVYTPEDTAFLTDARALGLQAISGWELFFHQGVQAWAHFSGTPLDEDRLRADLRAG